MTGLSTTIRVTTDQRDRLRKLAEQRHSTMTAALDDALEALRRNQFFEEMTASEARLQADPAAWADYVNQRDEWLNPDAASAQ